MKKASINRKLSKNDKKNTIKEALSLWLKKFLRIFKCEFIITMNIKLYDSMFLCQIYNILINF